MAKKNVCIVGGGATSVALLWALSQDPAARSEWNVTLIHDQPAPSANGIGGVGGHSLTYYVPVPGKNKTLPIDIGVQFISPMMYPSVHVMLERPEFQSRVPMNDYDSLKVAAAFPRLNGQPMNWGNFHDYQQGPNFALYSTEMKLDANLFQDFIETELFDHWSMKTLYDFFYPNPPIPFINKTDFINYILSPYMSIINGYGNALLNDTLFVDLLSIFATLSAEIVWLPHPARKFYETRHRLAEICERRAVVGQSNARRRTDIYHFAGDLRFEGQRGVDGLIHRSSHRAVEQKRKQANISS